MHCHSCGADVREGQKFCMECGASLRGVADITGEVPVVRTGGARDDATAEVATVPSPAVSPPRGEQPPPPAPRPDVTAPITATATTATMRMPTETGGVRVVEATSPPVDLTAPVPAVGPSTGQLPAGPPPAARSAEAAPTGFRVRPLLVFAILAAGAAVLAVLTTIVRITPPPDGAVPDYTVNGLGTNNAIAALIPAAAAVIGALIWCAGRRWGAGSPAAPGPRSQVGPPCSSASPNGVSTPPPVPRSSGRSGSTPCGLPPRSASSCSSPHSPGPVGTVEAASIPGSRPSPRCRS